MSYSQETGHAIYRVSSRGQFSLPASARRRWGIERGGEVELFDLGDAVVMLPGSAIATAAGNLPPRLAAAAQGEGVRVLSRR